MRSSVVGEAGFVPALVVAAACSLAPAAGAQVAPGQEGADAEPADRSEEILATVRLALREKSTRRSVADDVDPRRGTREDRALTDKLRTTRVALKLEDRSVDEVLDVLRKTTAVNFVVSAKAREALGKAKSGGRVTMFLEDLPLENVLNLLQLQLGDCRFAVEYGAVVLLANAEYRPKRVVIAHDVRDLVRRPPDFPAPRLGLGGLDEEKPR
jgi:hypothetical protein